MVTLDGSIRSESALPYARALAKAFDSELLLVTVPAVPEMKDYRAAADVVETIRAKAEVNMRNFLDAVARSLRADGINTRVVVTGSMPARTIVSIGEEEGVDLIMLTSRGRGGLELLFMGSVAERVVQSTQTPIFMVPILRQEQVPEAV
jgi:nucleotide-binding universal stress UspA family protein